jgi:hypothetical protein
MARRRSTPVNRAGSGVTELLGLPGAGKSTVAQTVADWGTVAVARQWRSTRPGNSLVAVLGACLRAPALSAVAYAAVAARRGVRPVHLRRVHSVQRRHIQVKRLGAAPTVLDEGPVHALFVTLYGTHPTPVSRLLVRVVLRLLSRHVDRYLFLDTPVDRCVENFRRAGRTSARFNADTPEHLVEAFRQDRTYEEVLDGLRRVGGAKLEVAATASQAYSVLGEPTAPASVADADEREVSA